MPYEIEGFAQEEFSDESINVSFVCSWKKAQSGTEIEIGNPNCGGWRISPTTCPGGKARFEQFTQRLREASSGRLAPGDGAPPRPDALAKK